MIILDREDIVELGLKLEVPDAFLLLECSTCS